MHSVTRARLPNGLRVVTVRRPHLHQSFVSAFIEVGTRHEAPAQNGLSHLLEHMLFRGTREHPSAWALNDAIERVGGRLGAATHGDYTRFDLGVPPEAVTEGCRLLGSLLTQPAFSQLEVEKSIVREEVLEDLDEKLRLANPDLLFRRMVFGKHPLGQPLTGTLRNLERFTLAHLRQHLARHYRAGNMVVAVCSPLPHARMQSALSRAFRDLPMGTAPRPRPLRLAQQRARIRYERTVGAQSSLRLGFVTPGGERSPSALPVEVLLRVLDDGMSTRLHRRICDELGLAYEVHAAVELFSDLGLMDVSANVAHSSVPRLVDEVLQMLRDLAARGPSRDELAKTQHRFVCDLGALDDDASALAELYGTSALWERPVDLAAQRAAVERLRPEDLRRTARTVLLPERLNLLLVGQLDAHARRKLSAALARYRRGFVRESRVLPLVTRSRVAAVAMAAAG